MVTPVKFRETQVVSSQAAAELQQQQDSCVKLFDQWGEDDQVRFVTQLLSRMCHHQHGKVNVYLKPMLQRDFITALPGEYFSQVFI